MRKTWQILSEAVGRWTANGAFNLAASLSFYTIISLAPLVTLTLAAASVFYGEEALRGEMVDRMDAIVGRPGAEVVEGILANATERGSGVAGIISIVLLVFGASAVFIELQRTLNVSWCVAPRPDLPWWATFRTRLLAMAVVLSVGLLLLASTIVRGVLTALATHAPAVSGAWDLLSVPIGIVVAAGLFALLFKTLPDGVIAWRDALMGGLFTAVLFEAGRTAIGIYLTHSAPGSAYGASGSLIALLLWIYYSALIFLLGAEIAEVYARHQGRPVRPAAHAYATQPPNAPPPPREGGPEAAPT